MFVTVGDRRTPGARARALGAYLALQSLQLGHFLPHFPVPRAGSCHGFGCNHGATRTQQVVVPARWVTVTVDTQHECERRSKRRGGGGVLGAKAAQSGMCNLSTTSTMIDTFNSSPHTHRA